MDDYFFLQTIGEGSYGFVYKGYNESTKQIVAIKKIRMNADEVGVPSTTRREIAVLKQLEHPYIISLNDVISDKDSNMFLILEFLPMDLQTYMKKNQMTPMLIKSILYQTMQAMCCCDARSIVHCDLSPRKILVDPEKRRIKITGFGMSRSNKLPCAMPTNKVTTLWYRAPELLLGTDIYTCTIDMWSIGCIFAELARGKALFKGDSEIFQLFTIFRVLTTPTKDNWPDVECLPHYKMNFPKWRKYCLKEEATNMDDVGYDLLQKLLKYNPKARISAEIAIQHLYFNDIRDQMASSSSHNYY